jgi:GNAT acetyltransferase-like protein
VTASTCGVDLLPLDEALGLGPTVWDALRFELPIPSPFVSWAWHRAWADASPPEDVASSQALVLRSDGDQIGALLPFRLYRTRFRRAPVTALGWAIADLGCPDHLDVPALPDADFGALVTRLDGLPWDVMVLDNVAERSPNIDRLSAACEGRGWLVRRRPLWRCPYLELPGNWDAYLASLPPSRRQTIRRKERTLYRQHDVRVTDYGPERLREGWQRLKELHERRWDGVGAFGNPSFERLHLAFGSMLAEQGALWLATLDLDGTPAAAWYGFSVADTVYFYQGGRDPRWERESVGAILMGIMIRRAIERGFRTFDFLRGEEPYKLNWTPTVRTCYQIAVIRGGWRGTALRVLDSLARRREQSVHV